MVYEDKNVARRCCAYCGSARDLTRDHVVPKGIYPSPRPDNLITVPCCRSCNASFSRDEEEFRAVLGAVKFRTTKLEAVESKVKRGLLRRKALPMLRSLNRRFSFIERRSPAGIIIGEEVALHLGPATERTLKKTARGLYFHHTGCVVPPNVRYVVSILNQRLSPGEYIRTRILDLLEPHLKEFARYGCRHEGVFEYVYVISNQHESGASFWILNFYDSIVLMVGIRPTVDAASPK